MSDAGLAAARFRDEFGEFIRFLRRPRVAPRLPGRRAGRGSWEADWLVQIPLRRLWQWAAFLWVINIVFLGPIAFIAAGAGGAQHHMSLFNIPWLQAIVWAPIVEELVFRYGLRRVGQAVWVVPTAAVIMVTGPTWPTAMLLAVVVVWCRWVEVRSSGMDGGLLPWSRRRVYLALFPWVFHASCLLFAAVHLHNFSLNNTPYWLMPLLVLPQWLTGLVLGWQRVKRGIGASMLLHGLFNTGPLLIVWIVLHTVPHLLAT